MPLFRKRGDETVVIGSLTLRFAVRESSDVVLRVPAPAVVYALLDFEGSPLLFDQAWANGDAAEITVKRVRWQDLSWRLTAQGWVRGPLRVWSPAGLDGWRASYGLDTLVEWFPTVTAAQEAAMAWAEKA